MTVGRSEAAHKHTRTHTDTQTHRNTLIRAYNCAYTRDLTSLRFTFEYKSFLLFEYMTVGRSDAANTLLHPLLVNFERDIGCVPRETFFLSDKAAVVCTCVYVNMFYVCVCARARVCVCVMCDMCSGCVCVCA